MEEHPASWSFKKVLTPVEPDVSGPRYTLVLKVPGLTSPLYARESSGYSPVWFTNADKRDLLAFLLADVGVDLASVITPRQVSAAVELMMTSASGGPFGRCVVCGNWAPLYDDECPDCRH